MAPKAGLARLGLAARRPGLAWAAVARLAAAPSRAQICIGRRDETVIGWPRLGAEWLASKAATFAHLNWFFYPIELRIPKLKRPTARGDRRQSRPAEPINYQQVGGRRPSQQAPAKPQAHRRWTRNSATRPPVRVWGRGAQSWACWLACRGPGESTKPAACWRPVGRRLRTTMAC